MTAAIIDESKHPLFGARLKLNRAAQQTEALMADMKAFMQTDFYERHHEFHEDTQALVEVIRYKTPLPPEWSVLIGELLHNLRAVLDYLVYELVTLDTGREPSSTKIQFPIFESAEGFDSRRGQQMLDGLRPETREFIRSLQPFATGEGKESPLWHLSKLSNRDKHRAISVAVIAIATASASAKVGQAIQGVVVGDPAALTDEAILYGAILAPSDAPLEERIRGVQLDGQAKLQIVFKEPSTQRGRRADELLHTIGKRVYEISERVSAEYFAS